MPLIRFTFNPELPREGQDAIWAQMNSKESWRPIEGASRLYPDSDDPEMCSQCYFRFTNSLSSQGRRSEVLTQYLFTMNHVRKRQYEEAWIVEAEPETTESRERPSKPSRMLEHDCS